MTTLKKLYDGKKLSADDAAEASNRIKEAISELEDISFETGPDHLWFKWGTLKSWKLTSDKGKELLTKYFALGTSESGMTTHDTPEQKELIYQMIDECDGSLGSDWTGEYFTKQQAKDYVKEYGAEKDL